MVLLTPLIHPQYVLKHVLYAAAERFNREKALQLQQFLLPDVFARTSHALLKVQSAVLTVPDQYRCRAPKRVPASTGELLRWLKSKEAAAIISTIVQKKVRCRIVGVCILAHGDYSLLHDKLKEPPGYDVILELTPRWDARACGHHSYVTDGKELVRVVPGANTLTIVHRPAGVRRFIKYVNHHAGKDRRLFLMARFA